MIFSSTVIVLSESHEAKLFLPDFISEAGILMLSSDMHPENTLSPSSESFSGSTVLLNLVHPENADEPIFSTVPGRVTDVISVFLANAEAAISVIVYPFICSGTTTSASVPVYFVTFAVTPLSI